MTRPRPLMLEFNASLDDAKGRKELRDGLSAVHQVGGTLWVANDESSTLERLMLTGSRADGHVQYPLADLLDLPAGGSLGADAPEIDIEGMDAAGGYLWVVGSHSLKRPCRRHHAAAKSPGHIARPARRVLQPCAFAAGGPQRVAGGCFCLASKLSAKVLNAKRYCLRMPESRSIKG